MLDFSMLSLNDTELPNSPEIRQLPEDTGYNYILSSQTMEDLFINLYIYEGNNTFEDLHHKIIDIYIQEASEEYILNHLKELNEILNETEFSDIYQDIMYMYYNESDFNLQFIIKFIISQSGIKYLTNIYNSKCIMIMI
jgi:hypothetical protein